MSSAPLPRRLRAAKTMSRLYSRTRRLEVNRPPAGAGPIAAIAQYVQNYPPTTVGFDFSTATASFDDIGLTPYSDGLVVPAGWMWWVSFNFVITTPTTPVPGDSLQWGVFGTRFGVGARNLFFPATEEFTPIQDNSLFYPGATQAIGGVAIGASPDVGTSHIQGFISGGILGSTVYTQGAEMDVMAIKIPTGT